MEIETKKIELSVCENSEPLDPSYSMQDISSLISKMKQSSEWTGGNLNSMVLVRSREKQILLNALHEDTEVSSYSGLNSVIFSVIEGRMKVHTTEETVILEKDQMLTLHDKLKFSIITLETTVFLLTIVNSTSSGLADKTLIWLRT